MPRVVKLTLYNLLSLISGLQVQVLRAPPYLGQSARRALEQKCKIRSGKKYACEPRITRDARWFTHAHNENDSRGIM
jgi:hypothetical protein